MAINCDEAAFSPHLRRLERAIPAFKAEGVRLLAKADELEQEGVRRAIVKGVRTKGHEYLATSKAMGEEAHNIRSDISRRMSQYKKFVVVLNRFFGVTVTWKMARQYLPESR